MSLTTLPFELILCVFNCLDWQDILNLRQTCLLLNQASKERAVFHNLVTRYASIIPKSAFHLERPLSLCTAHDLETLIYRWKAAERGWTTGSDPGNVSSSNHSHSHNPNPALPSAPQSYSHLCLPRPIHLDHALKTFHLIPGGRWLLVVRFSGAVSYYDLHHPNSTDTANPSDIGPPRQLIPDLTERRPWTVVLSAVDMDYREPFLAFNFAIYTRIWLGFSSEQIQIWRITLDLDSHNNGVGLTATRLALISPLGLNSSPTAISLFGHQVAWDCGGGEAISIVIADWTDPGTGAHAYAHPRPEACTPLKMLKMRKVVHPGRAREVPSFQLMQGPKLLLAAKPWLILYDLSTVPSFHLWNAPAPLPAPQLGPANPTNPNPNPGITTAPTPLATPHMWRKKFSDLLTRSLSKPFICPPTNTIRFVIFTRLVVYGLVIPVVDDPLRVPVPDGTIDHREATRLVRLGAYDMENEPCGFSSGYHTAVLHSFKPETVILRYRWPEQVEPCAIPTFGRLAPVAPSAFPLLASATEDEAESEPQDGALTASQTLAPSNLNPNPNSNSTSSPVMRKEDHELGFDMLIKQRTVAVPCKIFDPFTPAMDEGSGRVILSAQTGKQLAVVDYAVFRRDRDEDEAKGKEVKN